MKRFIKLFFIGLTFLQACKSNSSNDQEQGDSTSVQSEDTAGVDTDGDESQAAGFGDLNEVIFSFDGFNGDEFQKVSDHESDQDGMTSNTYTFYRKNNLSIAEIVYDGAFMKGYVRYFRVDEQLVKTEVNTRSRQPDDENVNHSEFHYFFRPGTSQVTHTFYKEKSLPMTQEGLSQGKGFDLVSIVEWDPFSAKPKNWTDAVQQIHQMEGIMLRLSAFDDIGKYGIAVFDCKDNKIKMYSPDSGTEEFTIGISGGMVVTEAHGLNPLVAKPDYELLHFRILGSDNTRLHIEFDKDDPYSAGYWTDKSQDGLKIVPELEYWQSYRSVSVQPLLNPVRVKPSDDAEVVIREADLTITEYNGDWAKVINNECNGDQTFKEGWIRWRNGDKLLVRIYYLC